MANGRTRSDARTAKANAGERPEPPAEFDLHDEQIIALLREDGRMSVRELGERMGLNEATVRSRIRRLEESGAMRVVAMVDLAAIGFNLIVPVGVGVRGRRVEEVGNDLARLECVLSVSSSVGVRDLEVQVIAKTNEELRDILVRILPGIPGVVNIDASIAVDVRKYDSPWVPFV